MRCGEKFISRMSTTTTSLSRISFVGLIATVLLAAPNDLHGAGFSDFAVYVTGSGCGAITIAGNTFTDSFDSSMGPYAQTKQLSRGHIGVTGNIDLSGKATINGTIFALNTNT